MKLQRMNIWKLKRLIFIGLAIALPMSIRAQHLRKTIMKDTQIHFSRIKANGLNIFYREAGPKDAPVILLLHGYPTSSHMFRNLIPVLSEKYHVIAPDLPGFGFSESKSHDQFAYTFDNLAKTMQSFIDELGLKHFALYVFDYGAPTGYRLAMANPEKITALISQNGNAYEEGLSEGWNPIQRYWEQPTAANRTALNDFVSKDATWYQYHEGVSDPALIAPEAYTMDQHFLDRPGNIDIQLDLLLDYRTNVALYPKFQEYFRKYQPPFLAVWGNKDPYFLPAGAKAYQRDIPNATVKFYDTGHFALETNAQDIGNDILVFLNSNVSDSTIK
jgi:pimeloyl-ACP methyl ester carboxylesterase